jgi:hypothetical protein
MFIHFTDNTIMMKPGYAAEKIFIRFPGILGPTHITLIFIAF